MDQWDRTIRTYSRFDIIKYAVNDFAWQELRMALKGTSTQEKLKELDTWLKRNQYSHAANVQVDNYLGALKRGGQISAGGKVLK